MTADRLRTAGPPTARPPAPRPAEPTAPTPQVPAVPAVPRWAEWAAHLVPLTVVPSGLWRLALGVGIPVGFSGELAELYAAPGWITPYVIVLSLLAEAAAMLTYGLVRPWGEVAPDWVPLVGGRRLPVLAVAVPALLGAAALTVVTVSSAMLWNGPENNGDPDAPHGLAGVVMAVCYAPLLAWGPLLAVVTVAYAVRRYRHGDLPRTGSPAPRRR